MTLVILNYKDNFFSVILIWNLSIVDIVALTYGHDINIDHLTLTLDFFDA